MLILWLGEGYGIISFLASMLLTPPIPSYGLTPQRGYFGTLQAATTVVLMLLLLLYER